MPPIEIPQKGWVLHGPPAVGTGNPSSSRGPRQAMQLTLPNELLKDLIENKNTSSKGIQITFGKTPILQWANKTRSLSANEEPLPTELYKSSSQDPTELSHFGTVTHGLEVHDNAEKVTAGTDAAVQALKSQLAAFEEDRKSHTTRFVPDKSELPPAVSGRKALAKGKQSSAFLKATRPKHLIPSLTRSMPTSPSLGASRSPSIHTTHPPTSIPQPLSPKSLKLQALRKPLLHLLAIAPISENLLVRKTKSTPEDCMELVKKFGRAARSGNGWELSDRWYKELDVWTFPYPSSADRQSAISNAISAFDRLRISREDNLWQMLLAKTERGKGKVLSRLNLHGGPMNTTKAPAIKVHRSEISSGSDAKSSAEDGRVGRDSSRLTPRASDAIGEGMVRSRSQGNIKKQKVSEKEAHSKRLLSNGPKKTPNQSTNPKPSGREPTPRPNGKFKSAEFVEDSDEDAEMDDDVEQKVDSDVEPRHTINKGHKEHHGKGLPAKDRNSSLKTISKSSQQSQPKTAPAKTKPRNNVQDVRKDKPADIRGGARPKVDGKSPFQKSPLSSSPPMNASERESDPYNASSSSSSPLMDQHRRGLLNGAAESSVNARKRKADDQGIGHTNGLNGSVHPRPIKRHRVIPSDGSISTSSPTEHQTLRLAQVFKRHHAKYERLHRELSSSPEPSKEKIKKLIGLHDRLAVWKKQIVQAAIAA